MGVSVEWIIQTTIMLVIGIIGFFIKQSLSSMESKINKNNDRIEEVNKQLTKTIEEKMECVDELSRELQSFKGKVADEYVKKFDYYQTNGEIMKKLDRIWDILLQLSQKGGNH